MFQAVELSVSRWRNNSFTLGNNSFTLGNNSFTPEKQQFQRLKLLVYHLVTPFHPKA
ncbi:hypothetical protein SFC43_17690 [Bacteroides sp. CR5/BHMF/2]|nr:hypothetical protein [Bacteroides sp. CR5/BHMF/2]